MSSYENQENKTYGFWWGVPVIVLCAVASIVSIFPSTVNTNTMADEPKILALTIPYTNSDGQRYFAVYRDKIIEEFYTTKVYPGFNSLAPKIILTIAAIPASISIYFWLAFFLGEVNLGGYLRARAEYLQEKTRRERKVLDQLLELQVKISGGSLNND